MAGLREAASIAGLISLAEQFVQAASTLYSLFQAYRTVHPRLQEVVGEIHHLHQYLSQIWRAASRATATGVQDRDSLSLSTIFTALRRCYDYLNDVESRIDPIKTHSGRTIIKKLKIAAEKDHFINMSHQDSFHRQELLLSLETSSW
jgi:hypothetical protein